MESSTNSRGTITGAREKLNRVHVIGALGLAGLLGLATGSVTVFVIVGAVLIVASVCTGEIRSKPDARSGAPPPRTAVNPFSPARCQPH